MNVAPQVFVPGSLWPAEDTKEFVEYRFNQTAWDTGFDPCWWTDKSTNPHELVFECTGRHPRTDAYCTCVVRVRLSTPTREAMTTYASLTHNHLLPKPGSEAYRTNRREAKATLKDIAANLQEYARKRFRDLKNADSFRQGFDEDESPPFEPRHIQQQTMVWNLAISLGEKVARGFEGEMKKKALLATGYPEGSTFDLPPPYYLPLPPAGNGFPQSAPSSTAPASSVSSSSPSSAASSEPDLVIESFASQTPQPGRGKTIPKKPTALPPELGDSRPSSSVSGVTSSRASEAASGNGEEMKGKKRKRASVGDKQQSGPPSAASTGGKGAVSRKKPAPSTSTYKAPSLDDFASPELTEADESAGRSASSSRQMEITPEFTPVGSAAPPRKKTKASDARSTEAVRSTSHVSSLGEMDETSPPIASTSKASTSASRPSSKTTASATSATKASKRPTKAMVEPSPLTGLDEEEEQKPTPQQQAMPRPSGAPSPLKLDSPILAPSSPTATRAMPTPALLHFLDKLGKGHAPAFAEAFVALGETLAVQGISNVPQLEDCARDDLKDLVEAITPPDGSNRMVLRKFAKALKVKYGLV
ncbi:hypothetical protein JCM10207_007497 [Rhodosporidiobolus poonsookiae]